MWASPTLGGDPLKPPQIVWMFRTRLYEGETPQTPLSVFYLIQYTTDTVHLLLDIKVIIKTDFCDNKF